MRRFGLHTFGWNTGKRYLRSIVLFLAVYFTVTVTTIFQFPLWLWLTVEATVRYSPVWLAVPVFVYLGWQLDTALQFPLGTGFVLLFVLRVLQLCARMPKTPVVQVLARTAGFFLFAIGISAWWWHIDWLWILLQTCVYSGALLLNLYRRQRE